MMKATLRNTMVILLSMMTLSCAKQEVAETLSARGSADSAAVVEGTRASQKLTTGGSPPAPAAAMPPMIIKTVEMSITVTEVGQAVSRVVELANRSGGYVAGSRQWTDAQRSHASLVVRVPAAALDSFLIAARGIARGVVSENMKGEDITQEFVDLGSRLRNLEATEVELRELLTSIRANSRKAAEVLEVHRELTGIRAEIEQARGRIRYLEQMTAFSTITIELSQDAVAKPVQTRWGLDGVARDAVRALAGTAKMAATAMIWLLVYVLPIGLFLALIGLILRAASRSLRTRGLSNSP